MSGLICLQGGNEFRPGCREMDEALLERIDGRIYSIAPLACVAGAEYRMAANNGASYLHDLGVDDIIATPEPDLSYNGAVRAILDANVIVIPGGSPALIRDRVVGTAIGAALRAHLAGGGSIVGSSAGAMVLGDLMVLPGDDMRVRTGLGVVPDVLVLPHYGEPRMDLVDRVRAEVDDKVQILGIPACCGVVFDEGEPVSLGPEDCVRFTAGHDAAVVPRA